MPSFELLINGKMVPGAGTLDVINPATESLAGTQHAPGARASRIRPALRAGRIVGLGWSMLLMIGLFGLASARPRV
jgi:hypothetical protein